ncbi:MAG: DUF4832 domain-containing protein, partial [Lachnospiraceae bacterium]|nr:DUF4832 domain-containing protein [Lachnospiraceae bacterium]
ELIEPWRKNILLMQGLFIGNWGEMHGSRFVTEALMRELYDYFRMEFGRDMYLAVRRPSYLRLLSGEALRDPYITIFDDALLSSATDLGTFGFSDNWTEGWRREKELAFIDRECAARPVGGEILRAQHAPEGDVSEGEIIRSLEQMHISYLNSQYDMKALDKLKRKPAGRGGDSFGISMNSQAKPARRGGDSLYNTISLRLGYRFVFVKAETGRGKRSDHYIRIIIKNVGFASAIEPILAVLKIGETEHRLNISAAALEPGSQSGLIFPLSEGLPKGEYELSLRFQREKDGRTIFFANRGWEELSGIPIGTLIHR